ncbi:Rtel1, partial [Symbiodinium sp. CCMP2456]
MPTYDVDGVQVDFPYEAYDCQLEYMRAVVKALDGGSNALLESPTGTGKTLCLLCAALGWRRHRQQAVTAARTSWEAQATAPKVAVPRIFYASRTHTQLRQVMSELKRTCYKPWSVVLGSRQHFCLHQSVSRHTGARQNAMCRKVVDEQKCPYHIGFRKCGSKVSTALKDIEEIVHSCKEANVCPYFKVREDAKEAELLLLPYDYLLGTQTREALQVPLKNSILIFDEGHNIERSCEEIASFELSQADIAGAISEIDDAFDLVERGEVDDEVLKDVPCETFLKHLNLFKKHLFGLEDSISAEKLEKDAAADRSIFKARGGHVLDLLLRQSERGFGTDKEDLKHITHVIRSATDVLTRGQETANSGGLYLDKIQMLLSTAFKCDREELDNNYQLLITE